ncbi:MAG: DNA replication and repair protein RecF [Candidatus Caenarcaniphilales bacterium]|nr:DNA replication and repair protein RecF [Candidatus Caenarcaniphilales bacterium]
MSLFLNSISLLNFRNYLGAGNSFNFHKKFVFIIGPNAIGKTNLLEAIQYISFGGEGNKEREKILSKNAEQNFFSIEANYELESRDCTLECSIGETKKNIKLNGVNYRSLSQCIDNLPKVITFKSKESIEIVRGSPQKRREWVDTTLTVLDLKYANALKRYNKALEQRNSLLKTFIQQKKSKQTILHEIDPWDIELSKYGVYLQNSRKQFVEKHSAQYISNYQIIASDSEDKPSMNYQPSFYGCSDEMGLLRQFQEGHHIDLIRGITNKGPHRDDFLLTLDDQEIRHFASQGQQRTSSLALKMLQLQLWQEQLGYSPLLLLDDVAAELDLSRQKALFSFLPTNGQVFITTTHLVNLPLISKEDYQIINLNKM